MENGGLDTLAALCGGASKAYTDETENEKEAPTANQTCLMSSSRPATAPPSLSSAGPRTVNQIPGQPATMPQDAQAATVAVQMDPSIQQWQALATASAFGGFPNPAASAALASIFKAAAQTQTVIQQSSSPTVDPNTYMQQFAYYQYLAAAQAQHMAAQNSQQIVTQQPPQSPAPGRQQLFAVESNAVAPYVYEGHPVAPRHTLVSGELTRRS
jgi:hypothetical protein